MIALGFGFAVLCALSKAIDTLINKDIMREQSAAAHALYRILFATPVLFVFALLRWRMTADGIWYLLLYGVLEAVNIFTHQLAVKRSNPLHIEIISKSKVILVLIASFVLGIDRLSPWSTVGIGVFMLGTALTINFQSRSDGEKTGALGLSLEMVSVLARTFKPFVLKDCLTNGLASNETMAFLSMIVAFGVLFAAFRPRLSFREIPVKKYAGQAVIVALGMLLSGWAIELANAVIVNAIESTAVIFLMLISFFYAKKRYPRLSVIGSVISVAGIVLAIVL